ncbi:histidine phosphatase family protein [Lysinimonas soli]|uniref:Histidine phosphatase family protein n=1 Tax=Lysinimonas soli TaxID=1074233 RepID=A0ABW0NUE1_9MICO
MTFAFIRHGQTDWNRDDKLQGSSDIPLNATGREQAHEAARILADGTWQAVVSSPLLRARETAEIIARDLGLELGPSYTELVERDYGPLEGSPSSETMARWPNRQYPGAETIHSVVSRGLAGLARIAADYPDRDVVIVCHGTIIRYTLAALAGRPVEGIRNGSISTFRLDGDRWEVLTVNGAPLLPPTPEELDAWAGAAPVVDPRGIAG